MHNHTTKQLCRINYRGGFRIMPIMYLKAMNDLRFVEGKTQLCKDLSRDFFSKNEPLKNVDMRGAP